MRFAYITSLVTFKLSIILRLFVNIRINSNRKTNLVLSTSLADFYIGVSLSFFNKMSAIIFSLPKR